PVSVVPSASFTLSLTGFSAAPACAATRTGSSASRPAAAAAGSQVRRIVRFVLMVSPCGPSLADPLRHLGLEGEQLRLGAVLVLVVVLRGALEVAQPDVGHVVLAARDHG